MWNEADLSDEDLRSVYGEAALRARYRAIVEHYERKYAETLVGITATEQRLAALREPPPQNSP